MHIGLKKDGKIYINGAVIQVDRKVNIQLLNEATFLLESNLIEADEANTPLKQAYYVLQSAMLRPSSASSVSKVLKVMMDAIKYKNDSERVELINEVTRLANEQRYFDALKILRSLIGNMEKVEKADISSEVEGIR